MLGEILKIDQFSLSHFDSPTLANDFHRMDCQEFAGFSLLLHIDGNKMT